MGYDDEDEFEIQILTSDSGLRDQAQNEKQSKNKHAVPAVLPPNALLENKKTARRAIKRLKVKVKSKDASDESIEQLVLVKLRKALKPRDAAKKAKATKSGKEDKDKAGISLSLSSNAAMDSSTSTTVHKVIEHKIEPPPVPPTDKEPKKQSRHALLDRLYVHDLRRQLGEFRQPKTPDEDEEEQGGDFALLKNMERDPEDPDADEEDSVDNDNDEKEEKYRLGESESDIHQKSEQLVGWVGCLDNNLFLFSRIT